MPSFFGHVLPGTIILGSFLWHHWVHLHRYFKWRRGLLRHSLAPAGECAGGPRYHKLEMEDTPDQDKAATGGPTPRPASQFQSSVLASCDAAGRWPMMSGVVLPLTAFGIFVESYAVWREGRMGLENNAQHMAMYFFWGLIGFFELLYLRGAAIPPDCDYVMVLLALAIEGLLFAGHLGGRGTVDVQIHTYLVYLLVVSCVVIIFEMHHRQNPLVTFVRNVIGIVHGTWFYTAAYVLYPPYKYPITMDVPHENGNSHDRYADPMVMHQQAKQVTLFLVMNVVFAIGVALAMGVVVSRRVQRLGHTAPTYEYHRITARNFPALNLAPSV